jgi:Icc-related predicted phosphoesterase
MSDSEAVMKIIATSDLHGSLPNVPNCHVVVIAGDVCPISNSHSRPGQAKWLKNYFKPWAEELPADYVLWCAGNHDFALEDQQVVARESQKYKGAYPNKVIYLKDEKVEVHGVTFWFTPWTQNLPGWAFQTSAKSAEAHYRLIPEGIDILVSHAPPYGTGDECPGWSANEHVGSPELAAAIAKKKPKVVICGHIHEGYGKYGNIYNVSHNTADYEPINPPVEIELDEYNR